MAKPDMCSRSSLLVCVMPRYACFVAMNPTSVPATSTGIVASGNTTTSSFQRSLRLCTNRKSRLPLIPRQPATRARTRAARFSMSLEMFTTLRTGFARVITPAAPPKPQHRRSPRS